MESGRQTSSRNHANSSSDHPSDEDVMYPLYFPRSFKYFKARLMWRSYDSHLSPVFNNHVMRPDFYFRIIPPDTGAGLHDNVRILSNKWTDGVMSFTDEYSRYSVGKVHSIEVNLCNYLIGLFMTKIQPRIVGKAHYGVRCIFNAKLPFCYIQAIDGQTVWLNRLTDKPDLFNVTIHMVVGLSMQPKPRNGLHYDGHNVYVGDCLESQNGGDPLNNWQSQLPWFEEDIDLRDSKYDYMPFVRIELRENDEGQTTNKIFYACKMEPDEAWQFKCAICRRSVNNVGMIDLVVEPIEEELLRFLVEEILEMFVYRDLCRVGTIPWDFVHHRLPDVGDESNSGVRLSLDILANFEYGFIPGRNEVVPNMKGTNPYHPMRVELQYLVFNKETNMNHIPLVGRPRASLGTHVDKLEDKSMVLKP